MSMLTRDGTAEPVSRDQILRHARGQGNINFPCLADHKQDWQPYQVDPYSVICNDHTYIQRGRERGGWGRGGRGGGGVGQREQWEDPMATQSNREIELSQTNRGVGGVCVGVVPRVQSKLSRALHAHRGKKLLQDPNPRKCGDEESYGKV